MSTHNWFLLPAKPHLAPPDWQSLELSMLEREMILPATGVDVPFKALHELSFAITQVTHGPWLHNPAWRTAADVVRAHAAAGHLSETLAASPEWSLEETVRSLREQGLALGNEWRILEHECSCWGSPRYRPGPGMREFYGGDGFAREQDTLALTLFSVDPDENPHVVVGENTVAPSVPGSDEPLEWLEPYGSHIDFIGAVYQDIETIWADPTDGREYFAMDLNWHEGFGIGWHFMKLEDGGDFDRERVAQVIGDIAGQPMLFTHCHT